MLATLAAIALVAATPRAAHADLPRTCEEAISQTGTANAQALFTGAERCAAEGDDFDTALLLIVGQARGMTDLALLTPADDAAAAAAADLYWAIFYRYGGLGSDAIYADPSEAAQLVERIDEWSPVFGPQYDPGWSYRSSDRQALYATVARENIDQRLHVMRRRTALLADPRYAALSQEIAALDAESQSTYTVGTEAYERFQRLQQRSRELEAEILAGFPASPQGSVLDGLPPEVDPDVRNLHAGVNGPGTGGRAVLFDEASVRASWIAEALSQASLQTLLNEIDFETEALVAVWIGEQASATGTTLITGWSYAGPNRGWGVSARVGVRGADCEVRNTAVSYPFALAAVPRMGDTGEIRSYSRANFADGCGPAAAASPTAASTP